MKPNETQWHGRGKAFVVLQTRDLPVATPFSRRFSAASSQVRMGMISKMEGTSRFDIVCRLKLREEGEGCGNDDATMAKQTIAIANFNMQDWPTLSRLSYLVVQKFNKRRSLYWFPTRTDHTSTISFLERVHRPMVVLVDGLILLRVAFRQAE